VALDELNPKRRHGGISLPFLESGLSVLITLGRSGTTQRLTTAGIPYIFINI
jgi:hypothetical protein